jgi:nucleoside-diphosphate-sugar epimerase
MKILVTGIEGYIGKVLGPYLVERGHEVTGFDTGFYREGSLFETQGIKYPRCVQGDLRRLSEPVLKGCDAVVHLAELSNDPLGQHNPELTYKINHLGTVALAAAAKKCGISRFIYTSSCSVYGTGSGEFKDEHSAVNPQTAYAHCKVMVERDVSALADDEFTPTFLRNATAYGPSPRMRFDLVLNSLAGLAYTTNRIAMTSDGSPWRPLVHLRDIAHAIACALEAPREVVHNQIFNVGATEENYQIKDIAQIISEVFPGCALSFGRSDGDNRSYRVRFDKIHSNLPAFRCANTALSGARELLELFQKINLTNELFQFRSFTRLKQLQYLLKSGQIDEQFFWTSEERASRDHAGVLGKVGTAAP